MMPGDTTAQVPAQVQTAPPVSAVSVINMLRSTQQHHIMLSSMADQKASFLIGATVVTLTLVLGQWSREGQIHWPLVCLGAGCLLSGVFAALALLPRSQPVKPEALSFNPLFFGHFTEMDEQAYVAAIQRIIEQDRTIYDSMARDIHQMGMVLRYKKFFYLGWGYRCFITTLIATLLAAMIHFY